MRANFPKWDKDGDDQLSRKEVNALVFRPDIRGRVAAAVATLHLYLREHPQQQTIPKSDVVPAADGKAGLNLEKVFDFYSVTSLIRRARFSPRTAFPQLSPSPRVASATAFSWRPSARRSAGIPRPCSK